LTANRLIGAPSSGKTEILQALTGSPEIYPLSKLSPNALISGSKTTRGKDPSLAPRLDGKVLIIKDFTVMLGMRYEKMHEIFSQLRDLYDGSARNVYGTGGDKYYKTKFGAIAAVTSIIDKHRGALTELGERFLSYRLPEVDDTENKQRCKKAIGIKSIKSQERVLAEAAGYVLELRPKVPKLPNNLLLPIINIAQFAAKARCQVQRDKYTKEPEIPNPEIATRLTKQLCDLALGIAMAREKTRVTLGIVRLVQRAAIASLTQKRIIVLHAIMEECPSYVSIRHLSEKITKMVERSIRYEIEDLQLLDLVERKPVVFPKLGKKYVYQINKKYRGALFRMLTHQE